MTIITLHHLCLSHCVNLSVIVLDRGIFLRERSHIDLQKKKKKKRWAVIIVYLGEGATDFGGEVQTEIQCGFSSIVIWVYSNSLSTYLPS